MQNFIEQNRTVYVIQTTGLTVILLVRPAYTLKHYISQINLYLPSIRYHNQCTYDDVINNCITS